MAEIAETASSSGGADPITAVANAIGDVADLLGNTIDTYSNAATRDAALRRLEAAGVPRFRDWYAAYRVDKTGQNMTVIYVLATVLVIIVLAFAMTTTKE